MVIAHLTPMDPFGVRINANAIHEVMVGTLERYLLANRLVAIEGLPPSDDLLLAIARSLGTLQPAYPAGARAASPFVKHQVAGRSQNYDASYWHSDRNFGTARAKATVLQCIEAPTAGGRTAVCDGVATLRALDKRTRSVLRNWRGIYEFGGIVEQESERRYSDAADLQKLEDFTEPVVLRHPTTGEESVTIAERYVRFAESENTIAPGRPLLDTVLQIIDAGVVCHHRWKVGDILIWDNCATLHKGEPVGEGSKATHRVVVT